MQSHESGLWTILLHFIARWNSPSVMADCWHQNGKLLHGSHVCLRIKSSACKCIAQINYSFHTPLFAPSLLSLSPVSPHVWWAPAPSPATQTVVVWACVCGSVHSPERHTSHASCTPVLLTSLFMHSSDSDQSQPSIPDLFRRAGWIINIDWKDLDETTSLSLYFWLVA